MLKKKRVWTLSLCAIIPETGFKATPIGNYVGVKYVLYIIVARCVHGNIWWKKTRCIPLLIIARHSRQKKFTIDLSINN